RLREQGKWLFATRKIEMSPYNLRHYVDEDNAEDYVILAHSGHGANSYAIQFYLVYHALRIFLHLGWGGVYMDAKADAAKIRSCLSLAEEIMLASENGKTLFNTEKLTLLNTETLTVVGSDFYGSYWLAPGKRRRPQGTDSNIPAQILVEALKWLY